MLVIANRRIRPTVVGLSVAAVGCVALVAGNAARGGSEEDGGQQVPLPTTAEDFMEPGTQEGMLLDPLFGAGNCSGCHSFTDDGNPDHRTAPYATWVTSMMGQAARDPVFHVAVEIAGNDAPGSTDSCMRCHAPLAWLDGRSHITDPHQLTPDEQQGVSCMFCHRLVDPVTSKENPEEDVMILADLMTSGDFPEQPGNARYIVDPVDSRRGPLDDVPMNFHAVDILVSPFHRESQLCATCHDLGNPAFEKQKDGTFAPNAWDVPHTTHDINQMMPEQRTYSEWLHSDFANGGVSFPDNRFGGDHPTGLMESCQDCHMPRRDGGICVFWTQPPFFSRNTPQHSFVGANTWVLRAIRTIDADGIPGPDFEDFETGLNDANVNDALQRTSDLLASASDMELVQLGDALKVRVVNQTGHKLPTGYPEGRRAWINVKFFDDLDQLIDERGFYDFATADLTTGDTKVYEAKLGFDQTVADLVKLPPGESFHLVLNNVVLSDNRIPPRGFTNANYESINSQPVAYTYNDGQYWDDTEYTIPVDADEAVVTLYYQTTSKEYMEFLNEASGGTMADPIPLYDAWVEHGRSAPVVMDMMTLDLVSPVLGDLTGDGFVTITDLLQLLGAWGACPGPEICPEDLNCDGTVDIVDLLMLLGNWG